MISVHFLLSGQSYTISGPISILLWLNVLHFPSFFSGSWDEIECLDVSLWGGDKNFLQHFCTPRKGWIPSSLVRSTYIPSSGISEKFKNWEMNDRNNYFWVWVSPCSPGWTQTQTSTCFCLLNTRVKDPGTERGWGRHAFNPSTCTFTCWE